MEKLTKKQEKFLLGSKDLFITPIWGEKVSSNPYLIVFKHMKRGVSQNADISILREHIIYFEHCDLSRNFNFVGIIRKLNDRDEVDHSLGYTHVVICLHDYYKELSEKFTDYYHNNHNKKAKILWLSK